MNELDYFRGSFQSIRIEQDAEGNKSLIVKPLHTSEKVDYSNSNNLMSLSFNARKNANDLFDLVMGKYKGNNPAYVPGFEMLVALANLASELYMKCVIYYYELNQGKQCKGIHNLEDYFSKLPDDIKFELRTIDDKFDSKLKSISNYFNEFRYSFEFNRILTEAFPFSFAEKLNQICNSIQIKRPPEVVYSKNRLLIKQGEKTVWDSSKNHEYEYPIISKDD